MRSCAAGYSLLTFTLLFALLPPSFGAPDAFGGPFVDVAAAQPPRVAALASRQAMVGGLTASLASYALIRASSGAPVPASSRPAGAVAPKREMRGGGRLEARRVLVWSFTGLPTAPQAPAAVVAHVISAKKPAKSPSSKPTAAAARQYRVAGGDTLWAIARRFGTSVHAITTVNGMASPHRLRVGQVLVLPGGSTPIASAPARPAPSAPVARPPEAPSMIYRVQGGDTLFAIARRYGTTVGAITAANHLASAHRLTIGQRLTIPLASGGGTAPARELTATRSTLTTTATAGGFVWPARGLLTSRYGWRYRRHHDGVDLAAPPGSPIYAARDGRVVFAGWYYGYGRAVILEHGGGLTTLYGHASSLLVRTGETVRRGQVIARIGCTGRCSGPHLHFEVRIGGRAVNPLRYLD